nr:CP52k-like protein 22 [Membranobalanus longirostrum]
MLRALLRVMLLLSLTAAKKEEYYGEEYLQNLQSLKLPALVNPRATLGGWKKYMVKYGYSKAAFETEIASAKKLRSIKKEIPELISRIPIPPGDFRRDLAQLFILHKYGIIYGDISRINDLAATYLVETDYFYDSEEVLHVLIYLRNAIRKDGEDSRK